jgi:hypothetical protein
VHAKVIFDKCPSSIKMAQPILKFKLITKMNNIMDISELLSVLFHCYLTRCKPYKVVALEKRVVALEFYMYM